MNRPAILVFAYSDVGYACLNHLLSQGENVVAVYTHEDQATENIWFLSVASLAKAHGVPVYTAQDLKDPIEQSRIKQFEPELIFSFYYRNIIPSSILNLARLGAYNMHGSLLPLYRGRAPINWAVLHGEKKTGATLHVMVPKADAGDIVDQQEVPIGPNDTSVQIQRLVTLAAVEILKRQLGALKAGTAKRTPQDESKATVFGRRRPEDGEFSWSQPSTQIHNLVRALTHPYPGAFAQFLGQKTYFWKTELTDFEAIVQSPGAIEINQGQLTVACGDGKFLKICQLQIEGQAEQPASYFISNLLMSQKEKHV